MVCRMVRPAVVASNARLHIAVFSYFRQLAVGKTITLGTIPILCNQSGWVGEVGQMIMFYTKEGCFISEV